MKYARSIALACSVIAAHPAAALVGNAGVADPGLARHVVMIVGSRANYCTATAIARDIVLTAAHCVPPGADYKLIEQDAAGTPRLADVARVQRHPQFSMETFLAHRATADVALIKLARPLPAAVVPAAVGASQRPVAVGDRLTIAGYGVTVPGDGRTGGTARSAILAVTGQPGALQIRLFDPATRGERGGLGACTGDSGAPAFDLSGGSAAVIGVVSWTTGPRLSEGCGGLTGLTPLARYRDWIVKTAREMGSPLP
jgi:secreted trypsin-like serine protease